MKTASYNFRGLRDIFTHKGEFDGYAYILWVGGFDGVVDIHGCTDILAMNYYAETDSVLVFISSPDDRHQGFEHPSLFSDELQGRLYNYIKNYE